MATSDARRGENGDGSMLRRWRRDWPAWLLFALIATILLGNFLNLGRRALFEANDYSSTLAPFFSPSVQAWGSDLLRWSREQDLPVNLLATVMQLESCGHAAAVSPAGALGLFQVMPFHFAEDEEPLAPNTNAYRSGAFLRECRQYAAGDITRTLACYNGGPSVVGRDFASWPRETQRYARWGVAVYQDAAQGRAESSALDDWWDAGGKRLCAQAAAAN